MEHEYVHFQLDDFKPVHRKPPNSAQRYSLENLVCVHDDEK